MPTVNSDYFTGKIEVKTMLETLRLPIEVWVEQTPGVSDLLDSIVDHMDNASFDANGFKENDFRRNCAISLRQFLEGTK